MLTNSPRQATRAKFGGAQGESTYGTSIASSFLAKVNTEGWDKYGPFWAPTLKNWSSSTKFAGRALGRWVPVIGYAILLWEASKFMNCVWTEGDANGY